MGPSNQYGTNQLFKHAAYKRAHSFSWETGVSNKQPLSLEFQGPAFHNCGVAGKLKEGKGGKRNKRDPKGERKGKRWMSGAT